jgi:hypothetical protein
VLATRAKMSDEELRELLARRISELQVKHEDRAAS